MAKDLMHTVGERVKKYRTYKNMTQEDLSFRSGLHKNYLSDVERGTRNISLKAIEKIARGLEVDISELFESSKLNEKH